MSRLGATKRGCFVLLGPPGAGKGTQAERICRRLGLAHLSTGDLLRAAVKAGTPAGRTAQEFMDSGRLVPDAVVFQVLFDRLAAESAGVLLDGFPRNRAQAEELDRRLAAGGRPVDRVADLAVPDAALVRRLSERRTCRGCGRSYHLDFVPPARTGLCDGCGGPLEQRPDDAPAVVAKRLAVYREQTAPLVAFYAERGLLTAIDGDRDVDAITDDLARCFRRNGDPVGARAG